MKVSFDFDDTLDKPEVQEYAKSLVEKGIEVHIVTARQSDETFAPITGWNNDLYKVAKEVGIKKENIHFTEGGWKVEFFIKNPDYVWHLDNEFEELVRISRRKGCKISAVSVLKQSYIHKCNRLIEKHNACIT